jgi:hypothetical protein
MSKGNKPDVRAVSIHNVHKGIRGSSDANGSRAAVTGTTGMRKFKDPLDDGLKEGGESLRYRDRLFNQKRGCFVEINVESAVELNAWRH